MSPAFTVGLRESLLRAAELAQDRILRHDGLFRLALRGLREERALAEGRAGAQPAIAGGRDSHST